MARIATWWRVERSLGRGQRRLAAGDAAGAAEEFARGLESAPRSAPLAWHRALALAGAGRAEEAVASARLAVEVAGRSAVAHLFLGRVLVETGRAVEAGEALDRAIELDPANRVARGWRAIAHFESGEARQGLALLGGAGVGESPRLLARLLLAMEDCAGRLARGAGP